MCPQCDKECTYWRLNSTCESSKVSNAYIRVTNSGPWLYRFFLIHSHGQFRVIMIMKVTYMYSESLKILFANAFYVRPFS